MILNNFSPLPFYEDRNDQHFRQDYALGEVYKHPCTRALLPFQILIKGVDRVEVNHVRIMDKNDNLVQDVKNIMLDKFGGDSMVVNGQQFCQFIYNADSSLLGLNLEPGDYYIDLKLDYIDPNLDLGAYSLRYYSELFTYCENANDHLILMWWDNESLELPEGYFYYDNGGYRNFVYLKADIVRPEYSTTEEITERDGIDFIEAQYLDKVFKFNFLAPEFLTDALRLAVVADNVLILDRAKIYRALKFNYNVDWSNATALLAKCDAEFKCNTVVKKLGTQGIGSLNTGSYNDDYNEDYN